jgi:hypothetical protein
MKIEEIFKPIKGYVSYEVSNLGRVKSFISGKILKNCVAKHKTGKIKETSIGLSYAPNKRKTVRVSRLVADAFFDNFTEDHNVLHIDGNKVNCCAYNLFITKSARMTSCVQSRGDTVYSGVHLNKSSGKTKQWRAAYMKDGKTVRIGEFNDQFKSAMAYLDEIKKIDIECYTELIMFYNIKGFHVSKRHLPVCTCGNPSGECSIKMVNYEDLLYFCYDCKKQKLNFL